MAESISNPIGDNPAKGAAEEPNLKPKSRQLFRFARRSSKSESRKLYEEAVENAQYVMAYASSKCKKEIDKQTVEKLILAKRRFENNEVVDPEEEAEFWIAYQDLWNLVRPHTAECIRATEGPKARKTMYWHIGFTFSVLFVLLILQIYWVIGNQITTKLSELLEQETLLSTDIRTNQEEYDAIVLRFKLDDIASEDYPIYYPDSPKFLRDTAKNQATKAKLGADLEALKSQLERNRTMLQAWSSPWFGLIQPALKDQASEIDTEIENNNTQIQEIRNLLEQDSTRQPKSQVASMNIRKLESDLDKLNSSPDANATKISEVQYELSSAYTEYEYYLQLEQQLQYLKDTKNQLNLQKISKSLQEKSRQAQLAALFVLTILQSYLLPLLYGLLGASTYSLRTLSREIDQMRFSDKRRIQHMLRIALGALSGIMVGWFSFLYEGTTLLGSVPPLAIAFLVGYNIELFFSLMDRGIAAVKSASKTPDEDASTETPSDQDTAKAKKPGKPGSSEEASAQAG